jgi:hypothetical protein
MCELKAPANQFGVVGDEFTAMDTPIFGGDFPTLEEARAESDRWNACENTRATIYDDAGLVTA